MTQPFLFQMYILIPLVMKSSIKTQAMSLENMIPGSSNLSLSLPRAKSERSFRTRWSLAFRQVYNVREYYAYSPGGLMCLEIKADLGLSLGVNPTFRLQSFSENVNFGFKLFILQ